MPSVTSTKLWKRSIGKKSGNTEDDRFRRRLITSLESLREQAALLAGEIARDLPDYTVHDVSHSDALWTLADDIAGPDITLTPTEAYLFGGACAVHDLGMASAAYVDGLDSLRKEPRWSDVVAMVLRDTQGRAPSAEEIAAPTPEVVKAAQASVLRELHAEHAERLGKLSWKDDDGDQWLIEDSALRTTYGAIIGKIAHSHWWAASLLEERFPHPLGAPAGAPTAWTARPLLVACLLRLADASHLDASRAPRLLQALRRPPAASAPHWEFQAHLSQPYADGDRFVFTGSRFTIEQAEAWWLCAETLQSVDREFRAVDALLADRRQERLAVRGVAGGDDLGRLAAYLPTDGWTPLDARVRVSNVVRLVESLGGRELYGTTPHVPLRELIQNASDAVRARRLVEDRAADWGEIVVRLGVDPNGAAPWIEVEDTGVGMSRSVLIGHLLDFGTSFWESERVLEELPGLLGSAFEPTGRFGIGFFSVFMWGDAVTVTSRRHDAGKAETHVLEFTSGVSRRPLLRLASPAEQLIEAGTRVRVELDDATLWQLGLAADAPELDVLSALCAWLAPALDVTLHVELDDQRQTAVEASDWLRIPIEELATRVGRSPIREGLPRSAEEEATEQSEVEVEVAYAEEGDADQQDLTDDIDAWSPGRYGVHPRLVENARNLSLDDGTVVGRALVNPYDIGAGVVTIGGFRSAELNSLTGVLVGAPTTASRHTGIPIAPTEVLRAWATEQATLLEGSLSNATLCQAARQVYALRGDTGPLPILIVRGRALTRDEVREWAAKLNEVILLHDAAFRNEAHSHGPIELAASVGVVAMVPVVGIDTSLRNDTTPAWPSTAPTSTSFGNEGALVHLAVATIAEAWDVPSADLWDNYHTFNYASRVIGRRDGADVSLSAELLSRQQFASG